MMKFGIALAGTLLLAGAVGTLQAQTARAVEVPDYAVETADGDFELRSYPGLVTASVKRSGSRQQAVRRGFTPLANYIFAKNRTGDKIAMTAPVTQERNENGWIVSFIMPSDMSLDTLPAPAGDVLLQEVAPRYMATVRFSGRWSDKRFREQTARLLKWIEARGLRPLDQPEYGYYNDPFTPAFLRRNEVLIEVARP
ncbi:MAG: heme-binding protein [Pseudomonadota bacterium]